MANRVGIIGYGKMGRIRAEALRRVPEAYYENAAAADWLMNLYIADKGRIAFLRRVLPSGFRRLRAWIAGHRAACWGSGCS